MIPFPGDPRSEIDYKYLILDDTTAKIWAVGAVLNNAKHCVFEGTSGQWNNTPNPNPNSIVYVYGVIKVVSNLGNIILDVQSVALNIGHAAGPLLTSPQSDKHGKKRKISVTTSGLSSGTSVLSPSLNTPMGSSSHALDDSGSQKTILPIENQTHVVDDEPGKSKKTRHSAR
ncbi:hypothetical protein K439DRAFT_1614514 [Ramaria rubella]|nr:hypothetical protein K439DRAFT_1614514 [Ramaria rubella]